MIETNGYVRLREKPTSVYFKVRSIFHEVDERT